VDRKLNFGCGTRFSDTWVNVDFHSQDSRVQRANFLNGLPFADSGFSAVYSSHVLEHFNAEQAKFLLSEAFRVLSDGGILRIVVPDLEGSVREYLRVLSLPEGPEKKQLYSWAIIELLDQLVRNKPSGEMGPYLDRVYRGSDEKMKSYVTSRTENVVWRPNPDLRIVSKLKVLTPQRIATKLLYIYLQMLSRLVPRSLRDSIFVQTGIGERHRWMYDEYGLSDLFKDTGFKAIRRLPFNESSIPNFNVYCLDCNADGKPYKNNSIYMEGMK
jgi:predicted SAM-dependent methyltransferase